MAESLARAFRRRGHQVYATGKVWKGTELPRTDKQRQKMDGVVDKIIAKRPDVVFAVRSSAFLPEQVQRMRESGITTVVWFADDPLLYRVHSAEVAPHYDLCLHTATEPALRMYEEELGVRGFGFPFWTDDVAFPRRFEPERCDLDLVFIGNTHIAHKRWRYHWIADLPLSTAIYGHVHQDPSGIHAGLAPDDEALGIASARGRLGLNISQRFADHAGNDFDYPRLAEFGEFSLPSRIMQLAAIGVPPVSYVGDDRAAADTKRLFPPAEVVRSADELVALAKQLRDDEGALREMSDQAHAWYARHYTADSRVRFLEALLNKPSAWSSSTAAERAEAFLEFPTQRQRARKAVRAIRRRLKGAR